MIRSFDQLENVASRGHIKVKLDETNPPSVSHEHATYFERDGENILITIQETKSSGRTYNTSTAIDADILLEIVKGLMEGTNGKL